MGKGWTEAFGQMGKGWTETCGRMGKGRPEACGWMRRAGRKPTDGERNGLNTQHQETILSCHLTFG